MQHGLAAVDVFDEALYAAREGEILFLASALVDQLYLDAVVEKREFAQALGQDVVVKLDGAKISSSAQEMHFGAGAWASPMTLSGATSSRGAASTACAAAELHADALLPSRQIRSCSHLDSAIDHGHADAVQAAGNLVRVLIELAARVQLGHDDFGGRALEFVHRRLMPVGMPRPLSVTEMELSVWMVTTMSSQ